MPGRVDLMHPENNKCSPPKDSVDPGGGGRRPATITGHDGYWSKQWAQVYSVLQANQQGQFYTQPVSSPRDKAHGVAFRFFLRVYRICSEKLFGERDKTVIEASTKLGYPRGTMVKL